MTTSKKPDDITYKVGERVWSERAKEEGIIMVVDTKSLPDNKTFIHGYVVAFSDNKWDREYQYPHELRKL